MAVNKSSTAETVYQIADNKKLTQSERQKNKFKNAMMPEITNVPMADDKEIYNNIETKSGLRESATTNNIKIPQNIKENVGNSNAEHIKDPRKTGRPKMYTEELDRIVVKTNKSTKEKAFAMAAQERKSMAQYVAELIDRDFDLNYRG